MKPHFSHYLSRVGGDITFMPWKALSSHYYTADLTKLNPLIKEKKTGGGRKQLSQQACTNTERLLWIHLQRPTTGVKDRNVFCYRPAARRQSLLATTGLAKKIRGKHRLYNRATRTKMIRRGARSPPVPSECRSHAVE